VSRHGSGGSGRRGPGNPGGVPRSVDPQMHHPEGGVRLTVSIGVACFPEHATSPEELVRAADEALYEAKLQGRDRVVTAGPQWLLPLTARLGRVKGRAARVE
jgi:hypothetical protein